MIPGLRSLLTGNPRYNWQTLMAGIAETTISSEESSPPPQPRDPLIMRLARTPVSLMEHAPVMFWRVVFVIYIISLTLATHWPKPLIPNEGDIPVDKGCHFLAFSGLAGFLMLTRWIHSTSPEPHDPKPRAFVRRNIILSAVIAVLWAAADEFTQGLIPGSQRQVSAYDFFSNCFGILIAFCVARFIFAPLSSQLRNPQAPRMLCPPR